jgi:SAM-dependent methyltransferase
VTKPEGPDEARSDRIKTAPEIHTEQAGLFRRRYEELAADRFRSAFHYGRFRIGELLLKRLGPGTGRRLLDAGCGSGYWCHLLAERGFVVHGVDASFGMLETAKEVGEATSLTLGDVRALPYGDATFDAAISIEVIRYLPDPDRALRELHRVLKPGGIAVVTAAPRFATHGYGLLNRFLVRHGSGSFTKLPQYFTTSGGVHRAMADSGFADVGVVGAFLGPFVWFDRINPRLSRLLISKWAVVDEALELRQLDNLRNHLVVFAKK